jgi:hypothetical protein
MGPVVASAIEQRSLSALIPYAKTARTHSPTQVSQILATPSNRPPIDAKNAIPRPVFDVHLSTISAICRVSRRLARTPIEALERQAAKQPMTAGVNQHTEALWKVTTGLYGPKPATRWRPTPASRGTGATR